jgi:hypothetical protein
MKECLIVFICSLHMVMRLSQSLIHALVYSLARKMHFLSRRSELDRTIRCRFQGVSRSGLAENPPTTTVMAVVAPKHHQRVRAGTQSSSGRSSAGTSHPAQTTLIIDHPEVMGTRLDAFTGISSDIPGKPSLALLRRVFLGFSFRPPTGAP